jgi:putative hydroxymethylpyrimidine transport system substrate-binding protein
MVGVSDEPGILFTRNRSEAVVAVAAAVQRPLDGIVALQSSNIATVADLQGKTVDVTNAVGKRSLFLAMLKHAGVAASSVTVRVVNPTQLNTDLLSGKADASFGGNAITQDAELAVQNKQATIIPPSAGGVANYNGLVLAVQKGEIVDHAPIPRRFVQAVGRGYEAVRRNPQQAVADMVKAVPSLAPEKAELLSATEAMLPDFFPSRSPKGKTRPWGFMTVTQWNRFGTYLHHTNQITNGQAPLDASTNELLAGQGV